MNMLTQLLPGQFTVSFHEELGAGGLGRVNRVRIEANNESRKVVGTDWAAKRLNAKWAEHPVAKVRFEREITTLSRMSHPNIVSFEGASLPGEERFYIMPLYSHSVRRHVVEGGCRHDWRAVARYGAILADAFGYAHGLGFIHRDVKPENILFNPGGALVIADWGIGYFIHKESVVLHHLTRGGGLGTEYYCSSEQWATGKCGATGDVYSLGMTLDEWVTGQQRAITVGAGIVNPTVGDRSAGAAQFNAAVMRMTRSRATDRMSTMREVAAELRLAASI